jgi:hypothetical protein
MFLARGSYFYQLAVTRGIAKTTLMVHVKDVAGCLASTASNYIRLPTPAELPRLAIPLQDPLNPQVKNHN